MNVFLHHLSQYSVYTVYIYSVWDWYLVQWSQQVLCANTICMVILSILRFDTADFLYLFRGLTYGFNFVNYIDHPVYIS